jgi:hypothetical protein
MTISMQSTVPNSEPPIKKLNGPSDKVNKNNFLKKLLTGCLKKPPTNNACVTNKKLSTPISPKAIKPEALITANRAALTKQESIKDTAKKLMHVMQVSSERNPDLYNIIFNSLVRDLGITKGDKQYTGKFLEKTDTILDYIEGALHKFAGKMQASASLGQSQLQRQHQDLGLSPPIELTPAEALGLEEGSPIGKFVLNNGSLEGVVSDLEGLNTQSKLDLYSMVAEDLTNAYNLILNKRFELN